jgi:hypothetical protein
MAGSTLLEFLKGLSAVAIKVWPKCVYCGRLIPANSETYLCVRCQSFRQRSLASSYETSGYQGNVIDVEEVVTKTLDEIAEDYPGGTYHPPPPKQIEAPKPRAAPKGKSGDDEPSIYTRIKKIELD